MPTGKKGFQKGHKDFRTKEGIRIMAEKISELTKGKPKYNLRGANHGNWLGDEVGYVSLHKWVKLRKPEPKCCPDCGIESKLDLANLSGEYKRQLSDWGYKCRKCHKKYDLKRLGKSAGYKKYCIHGHQYTKENTAIRKTTGYVYCKECNRLRAEIARKKRDEQAR